MALSAWFDLGKQGMVLPTRRRDLLCLRVGFPQYVQTIMQDQERPRAIEYQQGLWTASEALEQLVDALYAVGKMDTTYTGFVSVLTRTGKDLLVVQELEPHVLVRLAYTVTGGPHAPGPDAELFFYVDRHGAYYPILLRGHQVGRAAQIPSQKALVAFADHVAHHFLSTGWLEQGLLLAQTEWAPHVQTELQVTVEERQRLAGWLATQGTCEATDDCSVRPYELCSHGEPSWFVALGLL